MGRFFILDCLTRVRNAESEIDCESAYGTFLLFRARRFGTYQKPGFFFYDWRGVECRFEVCGYDFRPYNHIH